MDIFERGGSVYVRFTRQEGIAAESGETENGAPQGREARVIAYVREHGRTTTAEVSGLLGEKDYIARRLLDSMAGRSLLVKAGTWNKRVYTMASDMESRSS